MLQGLTTNNVSRNNVSLRETLFDARSAVRPSITNASPIPEYLFAETFFKLNSDQESSEQLNNKLGNANAATQKRFALSFRDQKYYFNT